MSTGESTEKKTGLGTLVIKDIEYELPEINDLTLGELKLTKQVSDYGALELYEAAFVRQEGPALAALALIVIRRSGQKISASEVDEMRGSDFELKSHDKEDDEKPADPTPAVSDGDENSRRAGSPTSSPDSPESAASPAPSGSPASDTSSR